MTVRAENVIVSPTRMTAARTASLGSAPPRRFSRTRNTRNRP